MSLKDCSWHIIFAIIESLLDPKPYEFSSLSTPRLSAHIELNAQDVRDETSISED
jgi:hypothetical protein